MNIKKSILLLLFPICFSCTSNKNETESKLVIIEGKIKNLKDSTIVLLRKSGAKTIDTTYVVNQKFKFFYENKFDQGDLFFLDLKTKNDSALFSTDLWIEKNNLLINGDLNKKETIKIVNNKTNTILKKYRNVPLKYNDQLDNLFASKRSQKEKDETFNFYLDSIKKDQLDFLFKNSNNSFSLDEFFRFNDYLSKDSLSIFYNSLNSALKESVNGVLLKKHILSERIKIGQPFKDFEARNINGDLIKLSDYKGKIILLDFWAYWCKWCHVQNKEEFSYLNEKYKNDLVIISYSLDEEKDTWIKSAKKDSHKWVNLSNLKGTKDPIAFQYGVSMLPHSFLINKEGKLIKQFIGYKRDSLIEKEIIKQLGLRKK
jgi:peroxiredoxin